MTEIDLYKFIKDNGVEWHEHEHQNEPDVIIFIDACNLKAFTELLGHHYLADNTVECVLRDGYICIWMKELCEYFGIDMKKVF